MTKVPFGSKPCGSSDDEATPMTGRPFDSDGRSPSGMTSARLSMGGASLTPALRVASAKAAIGGSLHGDVGRATEHCDLHLLARHQAAPGRRGHGEDVPGNPEDGVVVGAAHPQDEPALHRRGEVGRQTRALVGRR